jgi:DNA-binding LacI/PurR family transcriptional regulator
VRAEAVKRTIERGVAGFIVWGPGAGDSEVATILESQIPSVFIDHDPIGTRAGSVMSANVEAMAEIVNHLYETGRRRISHVAGLRAYPARSTQPMRPPRGASARPDRLPHYQCAFTA